MLYVDVAHYVAVIESLQLFFLSFADFFFFSSRRRHTRSLCDWSSDVCSSDLSAGSFCLFCENGPAGLPILTNVSPAARAGTAPATSAMPAPITNKIFFGRHPLDRKSVV